MIPNVPNNGNIKILHNLKIIKKTYGLVNFQHKKHLTNLYGLKSEKLCFLTIICKRFKYYKKGHLLNVQKSKKL